MIWGLSEVFWVSPHVHNSGKLWLEQLQGSATTGIDVGASCVTHNCTLFLQRVMPLSISIS